MLSRPNLGQDQTHALTRIGHTGTMPFMSPATIVNQRPTVRAKGNIMTCLSPVRLKVTNGRIESTMLGVEDHGIMTFYLHLRFDGSCQGCGGFAIDRYDKVTDTRIGYGPAVMAIRRILETVGVDKWEDLAGKLIRVKYPADYSHRVPIIGNILEDRWFDLKEFFAEQKG